MKSLRYFRNCVFITLLSGTAAIAQPPDPQLGDPDDNVVPITGLEYLLIAGGAMGGYKLFKKKKAEGAEENEQ
jgi:hypothetical protein